MEGLRIAELRSGIFFTAVTSALLACSGGEGDAGAQASMGSGSGDAGETGVETSNSADASGGENSSNASSSAGGDESNEGQESGSQGSQGSSNDSASGQETEGGQESQEEEDGVRWDVGRPDTGGGLPKGPAGPTLSYIWIANSQQGTISKVDTQSMIEEGRYRTAETANDPSRSSVNLVGDVAVAGRRGGITKIFANTDDCKDQNGDGVVTTASDAEFLEWGEEECIAWHTPTTYSGQRGVAWTQGVYDPERDTYIDQKLWVASLSPNPATGYVEAILYDGDSGNQLGIAELNEASLAPGARFSSGAYGGAVDAEGNFWFTPGNSYLAVADLRTLEVTAYHMNHSGYGMTVGSHGYVWTCYATIGRFDPRIKKWDLVDGNMGRPDLISGSNYGGCMVDGDGVLWHSGFLPGRGTTIFGLDVETMLPVAAVPVPAHSHGISIDFYGYVWGIQFNGSQAYRMDPRTSTYEIFDGLVGAYTYSDMTGFALSSTTFPNVD